MTLRALDTNLSAFPDQTKVIFETDSGRIGGGYHLTELKLAQVTSIDCGGQMDSWTEASLQLLDGPIGDHMTAAKFRAIISHSLDRIAGLGDVSLSVEFAPQNAGLRLYEIADVQDSDGAAIVALREKTALCKPALTCMPKSAQSCC